MSVGDSTAYSPHPNPPPCLLNVRMMPRRLGGVGSAYVMLIKLGTQAAQIWDIFQAPTPDKGNYLARFIRHVTAQIRVI